MPGDVGNTKATVPWKWPSTILLSFLLATLQIAGAQAVPATAAVQTVFIPDSSSEKTPGFTVTIPAGWQFQGKVVAGLDSTLPSLAFRVHSPDRLTEIRIEPVFDWEVLGPKGGLVEGGGMPPSHIRLRGSFTATQFAERYAHLIGNARIIGPMDAGETYRKQWEDLVQKVNAIRMKEGGWQKQKNSASASGEIAALRIEIIKGTATFEERVRVRIFCNPWAQPGAGITGDCSARVDLQSAPKGQLDARVDYADSHDLPNATVDKGWLDGVLARMAPGRSLPFDPVISDRLAMAMLYRQATAFGLIRQDMEFLRRPPASETDCDWADFAIDGPAACKRANAAPQ